MTRRFHQRVHGPGGTTTTSFPAPERDPPTTGCRDLPRGVLPRVRLDDVRRFGCRRVAAISNSCIRGAVALQHGGTADAPGRDADDNFIVFGYSQSAVVASLVKRDLMRNPDGLHLDGTKFVLIANPMRPNGGILARGFEGMTIPFIGITFYGPTQNSCPTELRVRRRRSTCPRPSTSHSSTTSSAATPRLGHSTCWLSPTRSPHTPSCTEICRTITSANPDMIDQDTYGDTTTT